MTASASRFDAIVIGAGLHGLAAAWNLKRLGSPSVALLERFRLGHDRGSSHGAARVFRATYPSPVYVHLLHAASREDWPRLEAESGRTLIHKRDACFFGTEGGLYDAFAATMAQFPDDVEVLTPEEAARRFPPLRFEGMAGALHDRTAGIIAAEDTLSALAGRCRHLGVVIREEAAVARIESTSKAVVVHGAGETWTADRVVVAAGAWTADLVPLLRPRLTVVRQNVGYFRFPGAGPDFPVWCFLGSGANDFYYGFPAEDGVLKAARHLTAGRADDPNEAAPPSPEALRDLSAFLESHFTAAPGGLVRAETCLYTNTATEDFVIDTHPRDPRIVVGAGFSGHGFKFGPLTGRILAELALHGESSVPEFARHRKTFALVSGDVV
jgi:sarcosine oxidase